MANIFDDPAMAALAQLHETLDRKGPGSDDVTRAMAAMLRPHLPPTPAIVEMGCGGGHSAFLLAELLDATVTGVDLYPPFIAELEARRASHPAGARVGGRVADMADPSLDSGCCDLLWSEGAAYILGFDRALHLWQRLLRPGGFVVVSEMTWFVADPPAPIRDYFAEAYPGMVSVAGCLHAAEARGYRFLRAEALPSADWWKSYYDPLNARIEALKPGLAGDDPLQAVITEAAEEQGMMRRFGDVCGYTFFALQKPS